MSRSDDILKKGVELHNLEWKKDLKQVWSVSNLMMTCQVCLKVKAKTVVRLLVYGTLTGFFVVKVSESAINFIDAKVSTHTEEVKYAYK